VKEPKGEKMCEKDIFVDLLKRLAAYPKMLYQTDEEFSQFVQLWSEIQESQAEQDISAAVIRACRAGLECGVALCRHAHAADSQWSEFRTKKEWRKHFGVEDWRTITQHVRTRELTSKIVQVHVDDLKKEF